MKYITQLIFFSIFILSCSDKEKKLQNTDIKNLRKENDSLKKIISEINTKYIFDSISVRDIPDLKNTYKLNSKVRGKLVVIGFNNDTQNSRFIKIDSVTYDPYKIHGKDTLDLRNGGYPYEIDLDKNRKIWKVDINVENKYGKKMQGVISGLVKVKN